MFLLFCDSAHFDRYAKVQNTLTHKKMSNAALALLRKQIGERTEKAKSLTPTSSIESVISQSGSQEIQDNRILAQPSDENRKLREELEKLVSENKLLQKNLDNNHIAKKELEVTKDNLENSLQEAKRELEEERQLSKQWQQKLSGLQGQLDAALSKAHQQDETLQQLVTEKDQLTNQHQALQSQLKERKMEVDELKAQLYTKEAEMNSLKGTLDKQNQTLPLPETSQDLLQELNSSQERLVACLTELESTRSTCNRLAEELYTVEQNYKSQLFLLQTTVANQAEEISNYTLQNATLERNLFDVKNGVNKNLGELVENNKLLKARNSQIEEVIKVQCLGIKTVFLEFKDCWQYFIQSMKEMRTFHHQLVETKEYILKILKAINEQSIFSSTQLMMCKQELEEQQSQTKSLITLKHNLERQMEDILANNMFLQQEIQRMSDLYYKQAEENEGKLF